MAGGRGFEGSSALSAPGAGPPPQLEILAADLRTRQQVQPREPPPGTPEPLDEPRSDRVRGAGEDDGRGTFRLLGALGDDGPWREDHVNLEADQFGGELPQPIGLPLPRPNLEEDALAFDITKLGEPRPQGLVAAVDPMEGADVEHAYPRHPP